MVLSSAQEVVIHKAARDKLGISIKGGDKASIGNPFDPEDEGIFISKVRYKTECIHCIACIQNACILCFPDDFTF